MPKHQRGAPWRAHNRTIPVARRALMSLPLVATILLAGPANGSVPHPADHHLHVEAKVVSATRSAAPTTTTAVTRSHQMNTSGRHKTLSAHRTTRISGHPSSTHDSSGKPPRSSRTPRVAGTALAAGNGTGRARVASEPAGPGHKTTGAHASLSAAHATLPGHKTTSTHKRGSGQSGPHLVATKSVRAATTTPTRHAPRPQAAPVQPARVPLGTFMVTCYDLYGHTADGAIAGPESVAVDPGIIALGTTIYVPGIGERTADDTGGLIIGDHIDIWEPTYDACANWGVRYVPIDRVG